MPTEVGRRARVLVTGLLGLVMLVAMTGCGGSSSGSGLKADVVVDQIDGMHQFNPKKLEVPLNQEQTFTFVNKDKIVHNVTVPDFAIDMDIQPGQRIAIKIPAVSKPGRDGFFTFYCKYHQSEGESGKITVATK